MPIQQRKLQHATDTTSLGDLLERILDKGVVIAGDIRINLVQVELLTIQLRLVVCSVDRAKEIGLDWWNDHPAFQRAHRDERSVLDALARLEQRLSGMEERFSGLAAIEGRESIEQPPQGNVLGA
jgi:hypothetical protein